MGDKIDIHNVNGEQMIYLLQWHNAMLSALESDARPEELAAVINHPDYKRLFNGVSLLGMFKLYYAILEASEKYADEMEAQQTGGNYIKNEDADFIAKWKHRLMPPSGINLSGINMSIYDFEIGDFEFPEADE